VESLAPIIGELRDAARFWISKELETRILNDVGEPPG
jgi:predicted nucleic acid-binding protein